MIKFDELPVFHNIALPLGLPHFSDLTLKEISEMNTIRQPFAIDETAEEEDR